ncbi:hypothetical protein [Methylobacterium sp. 092160098-2]|uniref:hypothetical protein n=1 Tax=Methylobacterium sp. 092160098-2 TaxID=3025129 RepID=UPI0023819B6F|nr:hypothetical protein [Methylobacterium sp. 092160098-2]MDE4914840.1 hypothetical protein [Methylobacterium sp. 092160098-2]
MHAQPDFHSFMIATRAARLDDNPEAWMAHEAEAGDYTPEEICAGAVYYSDLAGMRADRDLRLLLGRCLRAGGGLVRNLDPDMRPKPFRAAVVDLINPLPSWPWPLSVDQAFEAYRWMVETHEEHGDMASKMRAWGYLFNRNETVRDGVWGVRPIRSMADLKERLQSVVLLPPRGRRDVEWRRRIDLLVDRSLLVGRPASGPFADHRDLGWGDEYEIGADLDRMGVGTEGVQTAFEPKPVPEDHPAYDPARRYDRVLGLRIDVDPSAGFRMALRTTTVPEQSRGPEDYAHLVVAASRPGETFVRTLARARDVFDAVVHGMGDSCDLGDLDPASLAHLAGEIGALGIAPAGAPRPTS